MESTVEAVICRRMSELKSDLINLQAQIISETFNVLRRLNDELLYSDITKEKTQQKIFDLLMKHDHATQVSQRID